MKLLLLVAILFSMHLSAQDINSAFISMPDSLSPLLTKVNRQDFADFLSSGMKAKVKNKFGGESEMLQLTDNYIYLKTTASSAEEMKMLPVNDSVNVICLVRTYSGPAEDSNIEFYTTNWEKLSTADYITLPSISDFYTNIDEKLPTFNDMLLYKAQLSAKNNNIKFIFKSQEATDEETSGKLDKYIIKELEYIWENGQYKKKH